VISFPSPYILFATFYLLYFITNYSGYQTKTIALEIALVGENPQFTEARAVALKALAQRSERSAQWRSQPEHTLAGHSQR